MRSIKSRGGLTRGRGMSEHVRDLWVFCLNISAKIHSAVSELTGTETRSSEQHVELGKSRSKLDFLDCKKIYNWLLERNPFMVESPNLHSLSTGLVSVEGQDEVSCDKAEEIGKYIQNSFNNVLYSNCCVPRRSIAKPLSILYNTCKEKSNDLHFYCDNRVMFIRLVAVSERMVSLETAFEYELTREPTALFDKSVMRKTDKSALLKVIVNDENSLALDTSNPCSHAIIDGGALLYRVQWNKNVPFNEIALKYVDYVKKIHKRVTVVFDGYDTPSTKDQEHLRRCLVPLSRLVKIENSIRAPYSQDKYLTLKENKVAFIKYLSLHLTNAGVHVINCFGDADCTIVKTAMETARKNEGPVLVVADDTDIVVMLLYHWNFTMSDIFVQQQKSRRTISIRNTQPTIEDLKEHLLFVHAWSGCDTTCSIFGKGKTTVLKFFKKCCHFKNTSRVFCNLQSSQKEVGQASAKAFKALYGGAVDKNLTELRFRKYMEMASNGVIIPEKLPPTTRAAHFHGLRVHHQIMNWLVLDDTHGKHATDWGWYNHQNTFLPVMTDIDVAPPAVKNVTRCNCSVDNPKPCSTRHCTCRKLGMPCISSCGGCHGEDCTNPSVTVSKFLIPFLCFITQRSVFLRFLNIFNRTTRIFSVSLKKTAKRLQTRREKTFLIL